MTDKRLIGPNVSKGALALLSGAIDLHLHPGPSAQPRLADAVELAEMAKQYGMRGALLKEEEVVAADQDELHVRPPPDESFQVAGRGGSPETAAEDQDAFLRCGRVHWIPSPSPE